MSTQYLVAGVSVVSAAVIAGSLICVGLIFNDINNFYDDALSQLEEFQGLSTGAWTSMTDVTVHKAAKNPFLIGRNKRQAQCNCGQQPNNCPPGPRGPRGAPGAPGENGHRGTEGTNGHPGVQISVHGGNDGCITCPVGPPGPAGPDGSVGFPGPDGQPGAPAYGGPSVGRPGPPGPPGNQGAPGRPGSSGEPGRQGKSGVRGRGLPGPAGQRGQPGLRGSDGQPGHPAAPGAPGLMGESGPMGLPGAPGVDGDNGLPGEVGVPGSDAEYCPCPPRDTADNYDIKRASHHGRVYGYSMKASAAARSRAAIARRRVNKHRTARLANSDKKTQHSRSTGQKRVVRRKTEQH